MTTNDDVKYGINILPNDHFQDFDKDKYVEADWDESKSVTELDANSAMDFEDQPVDDGEEVLAHFAGRASEFVKGNDPKEEAKIQ